MNKRIRIYNYDASGPLVFVHFLEEFEDTKKHFKINWPLPESEQMMHVQKQEVTAKELHLPYSSKSMTKAISSSFWVFHSNALNNCKKICANIII